MQKFSRRPCEAGCGSEAQWELRDEYHKDKRYLLCSTCLVRLVNLSLTPEQFKSLIRNGHEDTEFYLHDDFYTEDGDALQPKFQMGTGRRR